MNTLPKKWGISNPALLGGDIILSLSNGKSGGVKVKRDRCGQVLLYGVAFEEFTDRYTLHHDFRIDFENGGGNKFLKKATPPSLCKMFGEQEAGDGYLGQHFNEFTRQEVFLLVRNGSWWAIETRSFNDGTIRLSGSQFRELVKKFGITHKCRAIFDYGNESTFHLRLLDVDGIELGYEKVDKMNRKKEISASAMPQETSGDNEILILDGSDSDSESDGSEFMIIEENDCDGQSELVPDEAGGIAQSSFVQIHYYNGYLIGDIFGKNGKPGFLKKMTVAICDRMQPIYIPSSFVRMHLLPNGKPTFAFIGIGDGENVRCTIRWGGPSNPDDAHVVVEVSALMSLIKPDVGQTVLFNLVDIEQVVNLVTFVIKKLNY
ncbi:hypothetical protein ACFE04_003036 [Oxalis oulophora]